VTTKIAARHHYVVSFTAGEGCTTTQHVRGPAGYLVEETVPAAQLRRFASRAEAEAYAAGGSSYRTERDLRLPLASCSSYVQRWARREIRRAASPDACGWVEVLDHRTLLAEGETVG
jgi:hypothetical protein